MSLLVLIQSNTLDGRVMAQPASSLNPLMFLPKSVGRVGGLLEQK
jgi:hypothetical protein